MFRRLAIAVVIGVVLSYLAASAYLYVFQRDMQYGRDGPVVALADTALTRAEAVTLPGESGAALGAWYAAPMPGKPAILYFRGNAGSFTGEHERFAAFVAAGYGFLAFDYRGFPGSPGEVSQPNILADGLAAFDWLAARGDPILLWGRSLGSGPATWVASQREAKALLLETPFDSAIAVAAARYPLMPVWLMHDQFPVDAWIGDVDEPVFVAHGTNDSTIGVAHGERLYELAPVKAGLWIAPGADHGELWRHGLWERAQSFFADLP